jgi:sugar phosphate isomerase/epimerase
MTRNFSTRLNSFGIGLGKKYPDETWTPVKLIAEAAKVKGLTALEINYPEHFVKNTEAEIKAALAQTKLQIRGIQLRWPAPKFSNGGFSNADEGIRRAAIDTVKEATAMARSFGTDHVLLWPAHDGYEYPLQMDYVKGWNWFRDALIELADENPDMRYSIEYKPAEPRARTLLNTTGAVLKMIADVDRPNVGVTLDFGHLLMAGENPAQSAALCLKDGKMFGLQLNDSHGAADDGLLVGSIHLPETIELAYYLVRENYKGTFYFDTDPVREDPVRECEMNIERMNHILDKAEKLAKFQPNGDALESSEMLWGASIGK